MKKWCPSQPSGMRVMFNHGVMGAQRLQIQPEVIEGSAGVMGDTGTGSARGDRGASTKLSWGDEGPRFRFEQARCALPAQAGACKAQPGAP